MNIVLGNLEHFENHRDFGYCKGIKFEEVIRKMRRGRARGILVARLVDYLNFHLMSEGSISHLVIPSPIPRFVLLIFLQKEV